MAFFEDIGKKVSQTGQDAIKKTKILAETAKLNSQISGEKKIIAEATSDIGEKYVALNLDDPDPNFAELVAAIKNARLKIEELEDQIRLIKGINSCPNCDAELEEGSLFCTKCGTKIVEAPAAAPVQTVYKVCAACGAQLAPGVMFCSGCGAKTE